jgi:hypothetical protein
MGPALGINLAEFEFPAYFNYFVRGKRCTLVVDSKDAERDIRSVFGETLLGPEEFRNHDSPVANLEEDFDPSFPVESRPNFYKEFYNFRTSEASTDCKELTIDTLLDFCHFAVGQKGGQGDMLGVPPVPAEFELVGDFSNKEGRVRKDRVSIRRRSLVLGDGSDEILHAISEEQKREATLPHRSNSDLDITSTNISISNELAHVSVEDLGVGGHHQSPRENHRERRRSSMPYEEFPRDSFLRENCCRGDGLLGNQGRRDSSGYGHEGRRDVSGHGHEGRRESLLSVSSSRMSFSSNSISPYDFMADEHPYLNDSLQDSNWMYSQARWLGKDLW